MNEESKKGLTRRQALTAAGSLGAGAALAGSGVIGKLGDGVEGDLAPGVAEAASCVLTPSMTEGPYFVDELRARTGRDRGVVGSSRCMDGGSGSASLGGLDPGRWSRSLEQVVGAVRGGRSRGASVKRSIASPGAARRTEAAARAARSMYFAAPVATMTMPRAAAGASMAQAAPTTIARNFWLCSRSSS